MAKTGPDQVRDPGDAVPPGVAPASPSTPSEQDQAARRQLERLGKPEPSEDEEPASRADRQDEEVAAITRTVEPNSDAPSRAGITETGTGADSQRG